MSESEVKKCPECGGEMVQGGDLFMSYFFLIYSELYLRKRGLHWHGDKIVPFYCKNCGYIKLYKEMKKKIKF